MNQLPVFSPEEVACFADRAFFRTKAQVMVKVRQILENLHECFKAELIGCDLLAPESFNPDAAQFVKGEHLEDFPYQYLDYPRHYTREEKFAFRSLFWWGNHMVFALILDGPNIRRYKENIIDRFADIAGNHICLCLSSSLWEWKEGPGYTMELTQDRKSQTAAVLANRSFVKLARFIPLKDPIVTSGQLVQAGQEAFRSMLPIILP